MKKTMRQARRERYYRQSELAMLAGVSVSNISRIESGLQKPHPKTRRKIEAILGGEIDWEITQNPLEELQIFEI
jgi:transcriptional regulator with XRE-family HTH domain